MHKRWLGLSSFVLAGLLTVTNVGTSVATVYAAEAGSSGSSLFVETEDAAADSSSEEEQEEADASGSSSVEEKEIEVEEVTVGDAEEVIIHDEASEDDTTTPAEEAVSGLVFFNRWNQSSIVSGNLEFTDQYQEFCYDLGQIYDTANVKSVTVKVANQEGNVCIKFYDDTFTEMQAIYSNDGSSEYTNVPNYDGKLKYVGVMSMLPGEGDYPYHITITDVKVDAQEAPAEANEETLVLEGDALKFTEAWDGGAVEGTTLNFDQEWREYRVSLGKTIPGEDVKSVKVTFAEANSQAICIKTYGGGTELKADYGKSGSKSYTTYPGVSSDVDAIAIMAMNNQTYPFEVTVEKVEVVVDVTPESERPQKGVEYDIVDLRDPVTALMGDDFIIGTAASYDEFADELDMELVFKHFNGVTLGNELKPDAMLKSSAPIVTYELNGEEVPFPELSFTTPESRLDLFVDWNEQHPDKQIKIRGHVLVWHSQTPEFFFHEDYDTSKPLVTPEVMNKRLEIYIREVAKHFTAEDSKYRSLFYGWDVVNEAISDSSGTYRNGNENSAWWRVYNSQEFITNAFVYANRYMPANIALFYNDYNETGATKMKGICQLLRDVKATPGARIDGMGMQAHYQIASNNPSMEQFKTAAKAYAEIVDQVQVTELDFKGATSATDERLAERYKAVYDTIRRLRNEGVNFTGMTIWGVTDKHSWLQTANNNGGGSNGSSKQYPLLFDDYYKAKACFWTLVDAGELEPEIKTVTLVQDVTGDFSLGNGYAMSMGETTVTFAPMWNENGIVVKVTAADATVDDTDKITIFTDDGKIRVTEVKRSEATATENGYETVVTIPVDMDVLEANGVKIDFRFTDGNDMMAFNDTTYKQYETSKYYAETVVKPLLAVKKGTVVVDGQATDAAWATAKEFPVAINVGAKASATAKVLWDESNLYVLVDVKDAVLNKAASDAWEQDSVEVFIDENNNKSGSYQEDDKQYRINFENTHSFNGTKCLEENLESAVALTEEGYRIEAAFKWTDVNPYEGYKVGLDLQVNDADESGKRVGTLNWADKTGNGWSSPEVFGTILLTKGDDIPDAPQPETPDEPEQPKGKLVTKWGTTYCVTEDGEKLTGFQSVDGVDYYFNEKGAMVKSNWITTEDGKFYALSDGAIAKNQVVTKWGTKYIFAEDGKMITGFTTFDDVDYYCNQNGAIVTSNWITTEDGKYYAMSDGHIAKNVIVNKWGTKYAFDADGKLYTGFFTFEGKDYYAKSNGAMVFQDWITVGEDKYYAKADGTLAKSETITKWMHKYTFDENGVLIK
ncbi:endo-1,4-beta-xylanase [Butyrivibrio sp. VCB2006]|uniref:endo-1,4-beta-xylanase n=1 Tax=Butyrivibrio sp. VCB2006 TaxID=1280679 RepID=UPI000419519C|nr:endo-1,4-beta-xylanase [Butyrivibrio sp. VCB2006]